MKIPKSYNDFKVKQFVEFQSVLNQKNLDSLDREILLISAATGCSVAEVESVKTSQLRELFKDINLLQFSEPTTKINRIIKVNGKFYQAITDAKYLREELTTDQYVTFKELTKTDPVKNMASILPLLYCPYRFLRKPKISKNQNYLSEQFQNAKIGDVAGLVFFYAKLLPKLMETMEPYFKQASQTITDHMKEIEAFGRDLERRTAGMSR